MSAIEKTTVKNLPPVAGKLKKLHVAGRLREKDGEGRRASPRLKLLIGVVASGDAAEVVERVSGGSGRDSERYGLVSGGEGYLFYSAFDGRIEHRRGRTFEGRAQGRRSGEGRKNERGKESI